MRFPVVLTATAILGLSAFGMPPAPPAIGARVRDFALRDIDGRQHALSEYKTKKTVVVVFVGTQCPIANLYLPTLADLHRQYAGKGVQFLAINSNDQDAPAEVAAHARERKLPFPVLKDEEHKAADALGARRTPEACVLDAAGTLRYRGRIDDQYGYTYRRAEPSRSELRDAIDDLVAGRPVRVPETEGRGCIIGRAKAAQNKHAAR
jgi:peroxiredoxin